LNENIILFCLKTGSACSIGRSLSQQFGGSSSTVNELCIAPPTSSGTPLAMTSTRRIFASDTDVRGTRNSSGTTPMSTSTNIANSNVHHSTSSSTLRTAGYHHQVTYTPQPSVSRPLSVHPQQISSPSYLPENLSLSNRQTATNINHNYTSSTSLNSTASGGTITANTNAGTIPIMNTNSLSIKSIDPLLKGSYRVTFNDNSTMILRADCTDGQMFIDTQGKRYLFDRREQHQSESIQERLALMQQDHHPFVEYTTSQQQQQ
jgi:hypothetical protein